MSYMLLQEFLYLVISFNVFTLKWALNYGQALALQKILRTGEKKNFQGWGRSLGLLQYQGGIVKSKASGITFVGASGNS